LESEVRKVGKVLESEVRKVRKVLESEVRKVLEPANSAPGTVSVQSAYSQRYSQR
jgi:hypothetical protein